ncbi:hypothetical protein ACFX2A_034899 [Malus domestica]
MLGLESLVSNTYTCLLGFSTNGAHIPIRGLSGVGGSMPPTKRILEPKTPQPIVKISLCMEATLRNTNDSPLEPSAAAFLRALLGFGCLGFGFASGASGRLRACIRFNLAGAI